MDYKNTIITPKTDFPMRAGLPQREPGMLEHWNKIDVYRLMLEKNEGKPAFILHDGPPFSNGDIHMGHALNKTPEGLHLSAPNAMTRLLHVPYVPGWDNHGMPIESAIIKKQQAQPQGHARSREFRNACQRLCTRTSSTIQHERLPAASASSATGSIPIKPWTRRPLRPRRSRSSAKMYRKGYIYKGLKPVYWCPKRRDGAGRGRDRVSGRSLHVTVYVKFALKDDERGKLSVSAAKHSMLLIWTTTTWTLPGNLAISPEPAGELCCRQGGKRRALSRRRGAA